MSRDELAEQVTLWLARRDQSRREYAMDANHIGKLERGAVCKPAAHYRAALRAVLDATDAELGFTQPPHGEPDDDVDRKTFLKTMLGTSAGAVLGVGAGSSIDVLSSLSTTTRQYRQMEQAVPSRQLAPAAEAHRRLATTVIGRQLRSRGGYAALAEIAGLAAWLAVDQGDSGSARQHYGEAISHAEHAEHPLLAAYMTASLGSYAVETGDPRQGLQLFDRAAGNLDQTTPSSARAWLASQQALAHAALGDHVATRGALRSAEQTANQQQGESRWPWVFAFDRVKVARYQVDALGQLGDIHAATAAFTSLPAASAPKTQAIAHLNQARVLARSAHIEKACTLAVEALCIGCAYSSERITTRVRAFRATLPSRTREAADLDSAITALYEEHLS